MVMLSTVVLLPVAKKWLRFHWSYSGTGRCFYMKDGFPVSATAYLPQSTLYQEEGYGTYKDQNDNFSKKYTNVTVSNRYLNREPRFYNTVFSMDVNGQ